MTQNQTICLPCVRGQTIRMGVFGTYNARSQQFDFSAWAALGEGVLTINLLRPGDTIPYPVQGVTVEGSTATWTFDAVDTAIAGWGKVFLIYHGENFRDATVDIPVFIANNSAPAGETPPDPLENWYDQMLAASQSAQDAAQSASESAEAAEASLDKLPYPNPDTGTWWLWDAAQGAYSDSGVSYSGGGGGGSLPPGGTAGQYLVKQSSLPSDAKWDDLPTFDGTYEVTPRPFGQTTMATRRTYLDRDIVVKEIPYETAGNQSGGYTVTIGG